MAVKAGADGGGCFPTGRHYPGIAHLLRVAVSGLAEEWDTQTSVTDLPWVSIDTETTGRDAQEDRVVEVACVLIKGGEVLNSQFWLVNPGRPIPQEAFAVHGISDADVADKPSFAGIADELLTALGQGVPLAYNAEFDRDFIRAELGRARKLVGKLPPAARDGVEWMDPLTWARELQREEKSKALGQVCKRLGIEIEQAHRATDDAGAAAQVLTRFLADARVPGTYGAFIQEQRRLGRIFADERRLWRSRQV